MNDSSHTDAARHTEDPATHTETDAETGPRTLIAPEHARDYESRWDQVKAGFVDEPREAVQRADALVSDVLGELQQHFSRQRTELEHGLDDQASTEDLRQALGHYRGMIDRLLTC